MRRVTVRRMTDEVSAFAAMILLFRDGWFIIAAPAAR